MLITSLPLLEYAREEASSVSLENDIILSVQHLLTTSYTLFEQFFQLGLYPHNLFVLGKCYSTDKRVFDALKEKGVEVAPGSTHYDSHLPYDPLFDQLLESFVLDTFKKLESRKFTRLYLLDDGGHLIKIFYQLWKSRGKTAFPFSMKQVVAIEQTSSGYNAIKDLSLPFPLVNLARSWAKLQYESPLILENFLISLTQFFKEKITDTKEVLILGNGILGSHVKRFFETICHVETYDIDPKKSTVTYPRFPEAIGKADTIIGASGRVSLPQNYHCFLRENTTLVSISSTDREFDAIHLRKKMKRSLNCHENLFIEGIHLLNSGFPVNFCDAYSSADSADYQFTRSLIFGSVIQAAKMKEGEQGLHALDEDFQAKIVKKFLSLHEEKQLVKGRE